MHPNIDSCSPCLFFGVPDTRTGVTMNSMNSSRENGQAGQSALDSVLHSALRLFSGDRPRLFIFVSSSGTRNRRGVRVSWDSDAATGLYRCLFTAKLDRSEIVAERRIHARRASTRLIRHAIMEMKKKKIRQILKLPKRLKWTANLSSETKSRWLWSLRYGCESLRRQRSGVCDPRMQEASTTSCPRKNSMDQKEKQKARDRDGEGASLATTQSLLLLIVRVPVQTVGL